MNTLPKLSWSLLVDGTLVDGLETIEVEDPSVETILASVPAADAVLTAHAVERAHAALQGPWARRSGAERAGTLSAIGALIRQAADELARLDSLETGKPLGSAKGSTLSCARYFEYYAGMADKLQGETIPVGPGSLDFTMLEPVGVTAHIIPWNVPMSILGRSLAPALAAGNTAVVKTSELAPLAVLRLAELIHEAQLLPAGVLNVLNGYGHVTGEAIVRHPLTDLVVFTGSVATGRRIMGAAAEQLTPVVLELGGKAPFIVLEDAEVEATARAIAGAAFRNSGQLCTARTRLLVHRGVRERLLPALQQVVAGLDLGPGIDDPDLGPLVSGSQRDRVHAYVSGALDQGARALSGGRPTHDPATGRGHFYEATILDGVHSDMPVAAEEVFGPVLVVQDFESDEEALAIANATAYGLNGEVWTRDVARALRLARRLDMGRVGINGDRAAVEVPMAGFKQSGIGVEKGLAGLRNYSRVKSYHVAL